MSAGGRFDRVRGVDSPHYDEVPVGSLWRDQAPPPPRPLDEATRGAELARSLDPLPPPPLPAHPAVGPDFYHSRDGLDSAAAVALDDDDAMDIKPVHRFIPDSFKSFFRGNSSHSSNKPWSLPPPPPPAASPPLSEKENNNLTTGGVPCSPPHSPPPSPSVQSSYLDPYGGSGGSYNSRKERDGMLLGAEAVETASDRTYRSVMTYSERVEEYHLRYAYMKSWAGLLRILGCVELLLGAAVFACVCAYVHKDHEWFNMFGYSQPQMFGGMGGGAFAGVGGGGMVNYTGPKTPFVLVVAGLAWVVTVLVTVLGMTMYYRTILLDSSWWPPTECVVNAALGVLYMAGGVVYVRDTTRGGMCSFPVFNNGVNGAFCRVEAGQTAAIIFLFVTMVTYFVGAGVCLKLWRHEAARMRREGLMQEMKTIESSLPLSVLDPGLRASEQTPPPTLRTLEPDDHAHSGPAPLTMEPEILRGHIPAGHIPKPVIIADYVAKYPTIRTEEGRDQYKAVFNDQYAEYKELHAEVQVLAKRFEDMDEMMRNLPPRPSSQLEQERISNIVLEYQRKKTDPTFLEKRERCEYLKNKLSHIKQKIQEYNNKSNSKVLDWNDGFS